MSLFGVTLERGQYADPEDPNNKKVISRRARMKFKEMVRKVIDNRVWLSNADREMTGKMRQNQPLLSQALTFDARVALMQKPENRTEEHIKLIVRLLERVNELKRYGNFDYNLLARYCTFMYVHTGRMIIKQNHPAQTMYLLINGECEVSMMTLVLNSNFSETVTSLLRPGAMFGDLALLLDQQRFASIKAITQCELVVVHKPEFDKVLRLAMRAHYYEIKDTLAKFHYFDGFEPRKITELCFFGRINEYKQGDIILSLDNYRNTACFLISGTCDLIEVLKVVRLANTTGEECFQMPNRHRRNNLATISMTKIHSNMAINSKMLSNLKKQEEMRLKSTRQKKYDLFSMMKSGPKPSKKSSMYRQVQVIRKRPSSIAQAQAGKGGSLAENTKPPSFYVPRHFSRISSGSKAELRTSKRSGDSTKSDISSSSSSSETSRQQVIKHYADNLFKDTHLCRRVIREALEAKQANLPVDEFAIDRLFQQMTDSYSPYGTPNHETHFVKIATFSKMACFNIGENLENRTILANSTVKILELPKEVLANQKSVVWEKMKRSLDHRIPAKREVFSLFIRNRMYRSFRQKLIESILTQRDILRSGNSIENVPYSIRVNNDFDFTDKYYRIQYAEKIDMALAKSTSRIGKHNAFYTSFTNALDFNNSAWNFFN